MIGVLAILAFLALVTVIVAGTVTILRELAPLLRAMIRVFLGILNGFVRLLGTVFGWIPLLIRTLAALVQWTLTGMARAVSFIAKRISQMVTDADYKAPLRDPAPPTRSVHGGAAFPVTRAVAWCFLAPAIVLTTFVGLSGAPREDWNKLTRRHQKPNASDKTVLGIGALPVNRTSNRYSESIPESERVQKRPKWIADGDVVHGDVHHIVLSSELWSTTEEARNTLLGQTTALLRTDFQQRHHGFLDPKTAKVLQDESIIRAAVHQEYEEEIPQDFGNFTTPMRRIWWQVEVSPIVRTELYREWNSAMIQNRVIGVGTMIAGLTLLAAAGSLLATLKKSARMNSFLAAGTATGCTALCGTLGLIISARLMS